MATGHGDKGGGEEEEKEEEEEEEARDKCPARCCRQIIDAQEPRQETLTTIRYKQWTPRK